MSRFEKRLDDLESRFRLAGGDPMVIWTILVSTDPDEERERTFSVDVLFRTPGKNTRIIRGESETESAFVARVEQYLQEKSIPA